MTPVVVLGAGLGGIPMAYELREQLGPQDRLTVISGSDHFHFMPSNALIDGTEPVEEATWNAICLADFGDSGVAFVAMPQIPPRNVNWSSRGRWVHLAKIGFERYFLRKIRRGISEPIYEKRLLKLLGITKLRDGGASQPKPAA